MKRPGRSLVLLIEVSVPAGGAASSEVTVTISSASQPSRIDVVSAVTTR
jgi:hypothetical protein